MRNKGGGYFRYSYLIPTLFYSCEEEISQQDQELWALFYSFVIAQRIP